MSTSFPRPVVRAKAPAGAQTANEVTASRSAGTRAVSTPVAPTLHSPRWLFGFLAVEIGCQLALLFGSIASLRVFVRVAAFAASLGLLVVLRRSRIRYPAAGAAIGVMVVLVASLVHPSTNTFAAATASIAVNLAILGPIFWVPRLRIDEEVIRKLFRTFWGFHALSASFGVLQTYFPGRFDPAAAATLSDQYVHTLRLTLANGQRIIRPMGLTDTPGGASIGGAFCVLFAVALLLDRPSPLFRAVLIASMGIGCFTLYLSQVRCFMVMLLLSLLALALPFAMRKRVGGFFTLAGLVGTVAVVGYLMAAAVGGKAVTDRMSSLVADDAANVYYTNRGFFLEKTFVSLVPKFPLGAGLGRWGTMSTYFGDNYDPNSQILWVEVQWTGWLFDGGIILMILYGTAMYLALREALRAAVRVDGPQARQLQTWATVLVGYIVGVVALTFNCCPFVGTLGIDFWLLTAAVFAAGQQASA